MEKSMNKVLVLKSVLSAALIATAGASFAQTGPANAYGIVVSSTPVVQKVTVPKQICTTTTVQYGQPTGGGALLGAVVGGAIGNQFGKGDGRAVATVIGALGGGIVGNQIEAQGQYPTQHCRTENVVENRTVAQTVVYDYAGQRYTVQMPAEGDFRPGVRLALHVDAPAPAPVQTTTYFYGAPAVNPVVYYNVFDDYRHVYRPISYYSKPYYVAPHAGVRPVRPPVQHVHRVPQREPHREAHRDIHRNW